MTRLEVALFFHILGAFLFAGGAIVAGVAFEAARKRDDPRDVAVLLGLTRAGVALVGVGGLLALGFGLWLVDLAGYDYGYGWIRWAIVLFVLSAVLGAVGGRAPKRARLLASELAHRGDGVSAELRGLLDHRPSRVANYLSALLILVILLLMVWKPT